MKDKITLSINPSYFCNFRCNFCYLSDLQLADLKTLSPDILHEQLSMVSTFRQIEHVDLYGGEIALIKPEILQSLLNTIRTFYQGKVNVITNLSYVNPVFSRDEIELSVSWDYIAREKHQEVYENMRRLEKDFHLLILASEKLVNISQAELDQLIEMLNQLPRLKTVEIKPYSLNYHHPQKMKFIDHEEWVKQWILRQDRFHFDFINIQKIRDSISKKYSAWSDEHLYITPKGKLAVLEFDELGREYFSELNDFQAYDDWVLKEKNTVSSNSICGQCDYLGSCLSEHLQDVRDLNHSCNGFRHLLDWYKESYMRSL